MWTEKQLEVLEEMQHEMSEEQFAAILLILMTCKEDIKNQILSFYEKYGVDGVVTYADSRKIVSPSNKRLRIAVLHDAIDDIFDSYFLDIESAFKESLIDIIQSEIDFFETDIDVDEILRFKWGADKLNWQTRLWDHRDKWSGLVKRDLKLAFLRGDDITDVIGALTDRFESAEKALKSLYVTEFNAIESEARRVIFKTIGVKMYQYYATLDERTCPTCGELHGSVFPMTAFEIGVTAPPIHPHCRCFITPIGD